MPQPQPKLTLLPPVDDPATIAANSSALALDRGHASRLGMSALEIAEAGGYHSENGAWIDIRAATTHSIDGRRSIPPETPLDPADTGRFLKTRVQVRNETTFQAARRLVREGRSAVALNFANGVHPGGGFLNGARAQEEVLCRSSTLFETLHGDAMYEHHASRPQPDSTAWAIYSPEVPVFRDDAGNMLDSPWTLSFVTCAAPYAPAVGAERSARLLSERIPRVLQIAAHYRYEAVILGAWGCGAFGNDPTRTAAAFRDAIETSFVGAFAEIVFAVVDWSAARETIGPFIEAFR